MDQSEMIVAAELMEKHRQGDSEAFSKLWRIFRPRIYNYLYRCQCDPHSQEDLVQEVFMKIHTGSENYQPRAPLAVWVFTIVANTVRSHFRKMGTQNKYFSAQEVDAADRSPTSQEIAEAKEVATWLKNAISRLPLAQREVIVLSCTEQLEQQEIADILEIPVNTVKTHLRRARLSLAKELARLRQRSDREVPQ